MSRATAAVLFPDGTIRYAMYCGTTDQLWPRLFDTIKEAWDVYNETKSDDGAWQRSFFPSGRAVDGSAQPVRIFENYGGGTEWVGTATPEFVVSGLDTSELQEVQECEGVEPEWVRWG